MTFNISFGYWLIPFAITLLSFGWAFFSYRSSRNDFVYIMFNGMFTLLELGAATIVSLISWLVWALL